MPSRRAITPQQVKWVTEALEHHTRALDSAAAEALRLLTERRNVVLYGPPGTGKSRAALQVRDLWRSANGDDSVVVTTFHPSYSYEDFIEGWRPNPDDEAGFSVAAGVLLSAVAIAEGDAGRNVLLIMDEINRGDVARIFGEFITYIEHDKRGEEFTTAQNREKSHRIPSNLYLLGTMNTADKSINLLDVALRRRFTFVHCQPDATVFGSSPELLATVDGHPLEDLLITINERLANENIEPDRQIGHAMLCISRECDKPSNELLDRLCYDVLPLVSEYLFGEPERVARVLPGLLQENGLPTHPSDVDDVGALLTGLLTAPGEATTAARDPAAED